MLQQQQLLPILALICCSNTAAWQQQQQHQSKTPITTSTNRRVALEGMITSTAAATATVFLPNIASVQAQPAEFQNIGTQSPLPAGGGSSGSGSAVDETQFKTLPNGVKIKDFSVGTGSEIVGSNSRVSFQCSGRLLNLNGVVFYNTKNNNPDGFGAIPLTVTLGKGESLPGLDSGLIGMRKNGIRRIIVPAELAYSVYPNLEPKPMSDLDQRALDSVVKNPRRDATILFDVRLERFTS